MLLDYANPDAWEYAYQTLAGHVERLGLSCYRQDFNVAPAEAWAAADAENRRGITEIKHIMGLYRLWDALLERFPHLVIDNCASGGKRIDIETLRRSVPLWRSDRMCQANYPEMIAQTHNMTFGAWMPYSGTSTGRHFDPYRIRSAYAGGMTLNYTYTEYNPFGEDAEETENIRKFSEEYLRVRPYFAEDMYPLTIPSDATDVWSAVQFDRPEKKDGVLQVFRRENSPYEKAVYALGGIRAGDNYVFEDADTGECFTVSGQELIEKGVSLEITEKRCAKIYFYHH
jgi:alpha-galactosidase